MTENNPVFIIAEAGVNHNGSLEMAIQLIDSAVDAGVDAIKFQTFNAVQLSSRFSPKAEYQMHTTNPAESQLEMLKKLELSLETHRRIIDYCQQKKIRFLSSPFDLESAALLVEHLKLTQIKLGAGEITNAPLLLQIARSKSAVILSTGMCLLGEIETALGVLAFGYTMKGEPSVERFQQAYVSNEGQQALKNNVVLLHCTTEYPTPFSEVNLRAMQTLMTAFNLPVGLSDHTTGYAVAIAAVALGARIIEKHFTLDKCLPGPDHQASLEPNELKMMVRSIREVESAIGSSLKIPVEIEVKNRQIVRKSLVAAIDIKKGETFTSGNLTCKRPAGGISPLYYWQWLGKKADRDYQADEMVNE